MKPVYFITGGTGFVGANLILELLNQTDGEIYCLVRNPKNDHSRLHAILLQAAAMYEYDDLTKEAVISRCHAVTGDLLLENCGVESALPEVDEFWHCAASLRFENRYADEIFDTNVGGTLHALALAKQLRVKIFNYISTAYVSGTRTGIIHEDVVSEVSTCNLYEQSKVQAEKIVSNTVDFRTRIMRPSIVVGHSKTLAAMNFSGFYGFLRKTANFKSLMDRIQEGFCERESVQMMVVPESPLNLVPVDHVCRQAVQISLSNSAEKVFHLTNGTPPTVRQAIDVVFSEVGIKLPAYTDNKDTFSWIDNKFGDMLVFYNSYLITPKGFDRTNTDAAIGNTAGSSMFYDNSMLSELSQWYLVRLAEETAEKAAAKLTARAMAAAK